jgi:predicted RNase H-like nuclease (RuvC/YqgF family)
MNTELKALEEKLKELQKHNEFLQQKLKEYERENLSLKLQLSKIKNIIEIPQCLNNKESINLYDHLSEK